MKILYIGSGAGTSGHRKDAMARLGHEVTLRDPYTLLPSNALVGQWMRQTGGVGLVEVVRARLLRSLGAQEFDAAWIDNGATVSAGLVRDLKRRVANVLCYNVDDPFGKRDGMLWREFIKAVPLYDLLAVVRLPNIEEAYRNGAKRVMRVYRSADEVAHAPRRLSSLEYETWRSEVVFIGTAFPERGPFLSELVKLGVPLTIHGERYQRLAQWSLLRPHWRAANAAESESYANAISAARICLGLVSSANRDLHTTRSMEIPALGGLLCAQRTAEHSALYEEDREAVFWSTPEECAAKCLALLADESRRIEIAAAGRRRYVSNPWQNETVIRSILEAAWSATAAPAFEESAAPGSIGATASSPVTIEETRTESNAIS